MNNISKTQRSRQQLGTCAFLVLTLGCATVVPVFASEGAGENSHRLAYHAGSLIGLALLIASVLIAWWLNSMQPARRVLGTFLAAAMTLGVGASIVYLHFIGALDDVIAPKLPTDGVKPSLMRVLGGAFILAGVFLLLVTYWQTKRKDLLVLETPNQEDKYGLLSRLLHWTTAILFILLIPMGTYTSMIPEDVWYRQGYYVVHKSLGILVLLLFSIRILWHRRSPKPSLDNSLGPWEKKSAHAAHFLLYVLMIAFPITGFVLSTYAGKLSHFFIWDLPLFFSPDDKLIVPWAVLHKLLLPALFYVIFFAHIAGALKHRYIDRHSNAFTRMVG